MIRSLYKRIRVVHCSEGKIFTVETSNWWFSWTTLRGWSYGDNSSIGFGSILSEEQARVAAIAYAQKLFERTVIWEKSNISYF